MDVNNVFQGMFGKIEPGMCRLSVNGNIAVKTSGGYKSYNLDKQTITNCTNFVFDIGDDMFFLIPTNHVAPGDIVLIGGKPKCVTASDDKVITAIDYESGEIKQILPERHIFMGSTYFYGKIVSMFGNTNFMKGKKGINKMVQIMMMSEMMKGGNNSSGVGGGISGMLPLMMLSNGGMGDLFDGMFDFGMEIDDAEQEDE